MCQWSSVLKLKEKNKATFFSPSENRCLPAPSTFQPEEREFVVDSGASMHVFSKKNWNSAEWETVTTSRSPTTVKNSQWRSADAWRGHSLRQRIGKFLDYECLREYASSLIARKALRWRRIFLRMDQRSKSHLVQNGIRIQCNTENFVPIVVLGLSTSSSSSLPSSTSVTPSRQEINHPTSSSSSSTSPSMKSSTVSSESVAGQERWGPVRDRALSRSCVK